MNTTSASSYLGVLPPAVSAWKTFPGVTSLTETASETSYVPPVETNAASGCLENDFQSVRDAGDLLPKAETLTNLVKSVWETPYVPIAAALSLPLVYQANKKAPRATKMVIGAGALGTCYVYKNQISPFLTQLASKVLTAASNLKAEVQDIWNLLPSASTLTEKASSAAQTSFDAAKTALNSYPTVSTALGAVAAITAAYKILKRPAVKKSLQAEKINAISAKNTVNPTPKQTTPCSLKPLKNIRASHHSYKYLNPTVELIQKLHFSTASDLALFEMACRINGFPYTFFGGNAFLYP